MKKKIPLTCQVCGYVVDKLKENKGVYAAWAWDCHPCRKQIVICFKCCDGYDPEKMHNDELHYAVSMI